MTRREIEAIAQALRVQFSMNGNPWMIESVIIDVADALAFVNPSFDKQRFLNDCGVEA